MREIKNLGLDESSRNNKLTVRWDSTVITNQCRYSTQAYDTGNPRLSQVSSQGSDKQYSSSLCTQVTQVECLYTAGHLSASPLRLLSPYQ